MKNVIKLFSYYIDLNNIKVISNIRSTKSNPVSPSYSFSLIDKQGKEISIVLQINLLAEQEYGEISSDLPDKPKKHRIDFYNEESKKRCKQLREDIVSCWVKIIPSTNISDIKVFDSEIYNVQCNF
jgi:hypothetical protein